MKQETPTLKVTKSIIEHSSLSRYSRTVQATLQASNPDKAYDLPVPESTSCLKRTSCCSHQKKEACRLRWQILLNHRSALSSAILFASPNHCHNPLYRIIITVRVKMRYDINHGLVPATMRSITLAVGTAGVHTGDPTSAASQVCILIISTFIQSTFIALNMALSSFAFQNNH